MITLAEVRAARERVAPVVRRTALTSFDSLTRRAGRAVILKPEHTQRTGSYKIRGAFNFVSRLPSGSAVVAASAGNHAQGVALAASLTGCRATIFMPHSASLPKIEATRGYGAEVRIGGEAVDDCIEAARTHAADSGAVYVPPFDHPLVIAGQGTVGLEIAEEAHEDLDVVVVPIGGGGLVAGVATALAHTRRSVRVVGVEAAGAAAMRASLDAGRCVALASMSTMADGIAVREPSPLTLAHVQAYVDDVVTVTEEEISQALLLLVERAKAVVEPAGAAGLAAILASKVTGRGAAAVILSGGNVDPLLLLKVIDHGLSAAGRYVRLRVITDDRPGSLARITAEVARLGLNVLDVEHHRSGLSLAIDEVEVLLTVETRDPDHRLGIVTDLRNAGFRVELVP